VVRAVRARRVLGPASAARTHDRCGPRLARDRRAPRRPTQPGDPPLRRSAPADRARPEGPPVPAGWRGCTYARPYAITDGWSARPRPRTGAAAVPDPGARRVPLPVLRSSGQRPWRGAARGPRRATRGRRRHDGGEPQDGLRRMQPRQGHAAPSSARTHTLIEVRRSPPSVAVPGEGCSGAARPRGRIRMTR